MFCLLVEPAWALGAWLLGCWYARASVVSCGLIVFVARWLGRELNLAPYGVVQAVRAFRWVVMPTGAGVFPKNERTMRPSSKRQVDLFST